MTAFSGRGLGYRRSPHDPRDKDAGELLRTWALPYGAMLDHETQIVDQGPLGSCVGNGVAQTLRMRMIHKGAVNPPFPSRLQIYFLARGIEGTQRQDSGCFIRDAYKAVGKLGFCPEQFWPYDVAAFDRLPSNPWEAFRRSVTQRDKAPGVTYHRITETGAARVAQVKQAIAQGFAVTFGTDVSEDYCSNVLNPTAEDPPVGQQIAGGHCQTIVGYEGDKFRVANSWGTSWGDGGFIWFSADYIAWPMSSDFWIADAPLFLPEVLA